MAKLGIKGAEGKLATVSQNFEGKDALSHLYTVLHDIRCEFGKRFHYSKQIMCVGRVMQSVQQIEFSHVREHDIECDTHAQARL